jgi:hypothetical protein
MGRATALKHTPSLACSNCWERWTRASHASLARLAPGVDPDRDRIVTAAVSLVGDGQESEHLSWLVDPDIEIPAGATAVHGITTAEARGRNASPPWLTPHLSGD